MEQVLILYPAIAMFFLTMMLLLSLGICRFLAIHRGDVSIKYYTDYQTGQQPEKLHLLMRHVQNHFEVPPLFYFGVILTFISEQVSFTAVVAAWAFVGLRAVHALIHLGPNNVSVRFFCFGLSLIALVVLWVSLLFSLI